MNEKLLETLIEISLSLKCIAKSLEQAEHVFESVRQKEEREHENKVRAGKRSAKVRKRKFGTSQPTSTSLTLSPNTPNSPNTTEHVFESVRDKAKVEGQLTRFFLSTYCQAYKARYGINPIFTPKARGLSKSIAKAVSPERLQALVAAYLQMDDAWFKTRCHDIETLHANLNKVAISLMNGSNDPHEKDYWSKVYGETDLRVTDNPHESNLGRTPLPSGTGRSLLADVPPR
jgi:hypothetical protein